MKLENQSNTTPPTTDGVTETASDHEAQFRTLADSIPQLAWMADADGFIFWYNRRWYDYTGTTLEEMQGWGWQKVHHPEEVGRVVERLTKAFATGEPWEDTFPLRSRTGEYRWFLSRALPIRDADNRIVRWFGTNTDVQEQRLAKEALRDSEERYRVVAETASDALITIDESSVMLFVNPATERMFGYTAAGLLGQCLTMLMPEEYHARHRHGIKRYIATGRRHIPWEAVPAVGIHKDGHHFPLEISFGEFTKNGAHFFTAIVRDISERKQAEENLRRSEELSQAVLNSLVAHIAVLDRDGKIIAVNEAWRRFASENSSASKSPREDTGMNYLAACAGENDANARATRDGIRLVLEGERDNFRVEYPCHAPHAERWFLLTATPLSRSQGGCVISHLDISDRKRAESELRYVAEERERLLNEVSTPVVPVWDSVVVLPLTGSLDTKRMQRATSAALDYAMRHGAHRFIIDITAARIADTEAVINLTNLATTLKLVGSEACITGVSAQAARSLVHLGLDLTQIHTQRTLAEALALIIKGQPFGATRESQSSNF
ncbi:MAG: PAS domain S-box protein [Pyrinomonadaceae bacterium MAG19_C2-C3]|nr:PAS domain S-box protein [Pyrinomonadaceae bacterium MAG19_C2-C3]